MEDDQAALAALHHFLHRESDILGDPAQQGGRDVASLVERDCRAPAIFMAELFMRAALADLDETESIEDPNDFLRLEDRHAPSSADDDLLCANELGHDRGSGILQQHLNDFP